MPDAGKRLQGQPPSPPDAHGAGGQPLTLGIKRAVRSGTRAVRIAHAAQRGFHLVLQVQLLLLQLYFFELFGF